MRVKNVEAVKEIFKPFYVELIFDDKGRVGFLSIDEYGGWPSSAYAEDDEDEENELEFDFGLIIPQLEEHEVLIVMSAGAEKARYITGEAIAIAWDGRTTRVELSDIYDKVKAEFGVSTTRAEY